MLKDYVETGMRSVATAAELIKSGRSNSLARYVRNTRVEPEVLVEQSLLDLPELTDLLQVMCAQFSGWYMMAASYSANIGNVETARLLDKLATHRDPINSVADRVAAAVSTESFMGLPKGLELDDSNIFDVSLEGLSRRNRRSAEVSGDMPKSISERPSLAVGRMLRVTIESEGERGSIDVTVRLNPSIIPTAPIIQILASNAEDHSATERFHDWRSGRRDFWRDIVFARDKVLEHRAALRGDETGTYERTLGRKRKNQLAGLLSLNPSVNNMSSMYVISKSAAEELERRVGGKLKSPRVRQRIFDATASIFLVVVDREWERVTIYTESMDDAQPSYGFNQLKSEARSSGTDVQELMKYFQKSTSPF